MSGVCLTKKRPILALGWWPNEYSPRLRARRTLDRGMSPTPEAFTGDRMNEKPRIYPETSVVSYLVSGPSADIRVKANQLTTTE